MTEAQIILIASFLFTLSTSAFTSYLNRRATDAKSDSDKGEAAKALSEASENIVNTYKTSVIDPLLKQIEILREQLSVVEEDRAREIEKRNIEREQLRQSIDKLELIGRDRDTDIGKLKGQIEFMIGELRRADGALEYAVGIASSAFPKEMEKALKIRRGQL